MRLIFLIKVFRLSELLEGLSALCTSTDNDLELLVFSFHILDVLLLSVSGFLGSNAILLPLHGLLTLNSPLLPLNAFALALPLWLLAWVKGLIGEIFKLSLHIKLIGNSLIKESYYAILEGHVIIQIHMASMKIWNNLKNYDSRRVFWEYLSKFPQFDRLHQQNKTKKRESSIYCPKHIFWLFTL